MKNRFINKLAILMITTFLWPNFIFAAEPIKSAVNNLNETIDKLIDIKDEVKKAELEKRSKIAAFEEVINLSFAEIDDLEKKLNSFKNEDLTEKEVIIKTQFLEELKGYRSYFQNIENDIKSDLSQEELKSLAEDLRSWRKQYTEDLQSIFDFLLVHQSKSLFEVAKNRWGKISTDLIKIKRSGLSINKLQNLLNKAKDNLDQANLLNTSAREEFLNPTTNVTSTLADLVNINPVRINIQKSLINVKSAYQLFFEMNNIVKVLIK